MSVTVFCIAFPIVMIGMLVFLFLNIQSLPVVKAGKVTKLCADRKMVFGQMPSHIKINGVSKDVSKDVKMLVDGNSMRLYNLVDGQRIYVKTLNDEEKKHIVRFPVLVLNIVNNPIVDDAKYKLRKCVGYVNGNDWEQLYDQYRDRMKISIEDFIKQCASKYEKTREEDRTNLILSETFDEDRDRVTYSLHPVDSIYGKVEFAI